MAGNPEVPRASASSQLLPGPCPSQSGGPAQVHGLSPLASEPRPPGVPFPASTLSLRFLGPHCVQAPAGLCQPVTSFGTHGVGGVREGLIAEVPFEPWREVGGGLPGGVHLRGGAMS